MTLLAKLPETQQRIVTLVSEIASRTGVSVLLVGGPVRDLLLGRPTRDLDFCVTGNLDALAVALSRKLDAAVQSNPRFLTASVETESLRIDLAVQRKEHYPSPGALPEVAPGDLTEDLRRRDFSVNAMAIDLESGEVVDPCHGLPDIGRGLIRVLHERSFFDDPTRIWRATRFSVRLAFEVEARTLGLMREAIERDSLTTVSSQRLRAEFERAVEEHLAGTLLQHLIRSGAMSSLFGPLDGEAAAVAVGNAERAMEIAPEADRVTLFVGALAAGASDLDAAVRRLALPSRSMRDAFDLFPRAKLIHQLITPTTGERGTLDLIRSASPEVLALVSLEQADPVSFHRRWASYRELDPGVRGDHLGVPPGPHVGQAIESTKAALFLGEIDESEALSFARSEALKYLSNQ